MPGASAQTRRVKILNANWVPAEDHRDGLFDLMIVTDDDQQHFVSASAADITALVTLASANTVLAWDPLDRTLIVANIIGTMPWTVAEAP